MNNELILSEKRKNKSVLVTGGAGYIGSTLVPMLLNKGYKVIVYDIFKYGSESLSSCIHNVNLKLIKGDILNETQLKKVMNDVEIIIHLAAIVGYPACDKEPKYAYDVNVNGTKNITSNLKDYQKLIFASTGSCYGCIKEGYCTEETPINPLTLYGFTKAEGENLILNKNGVCLRLATIFGVSPRMRLDLLINDFTYKALTLKCLDVYEPQFRRTFLHVRDVARGFIFTIENYDQMKAQIYNVGSDSFNYTKLDICHMIKNIIANCDVKISNKGFDADKRDYQVSYKKISKLGFKAKISVYDGIRELCEILPYFSEESLKKMANV